MFRYIGRRLVYMVPTLLIISIISFILIQLPPGDYLSAMQAELSETGDIVDDAVLDGLRRRYGLDKPLYQQYLIWIAGVVHGDFGLSFDWNKPVSDLIWSRLGLTMLVTTATLLFTYAMAIPIGIYSATRQYSLFDYSFTFAGFIGLATPNFLLALVLMFLFYNLFGLSIGGLFSPHMIGAPWSLARVFDLISHLWIPVIVIGTAGTAGLMRVMRGCLLDEIRKQYVITARSKGVGEMRLLFKYPVRISLFPIVSTIGWLLPEIISGSTITAVVLSLPTTGPLLLQALLSQDMFLAGSFLFVLATLTVIGTLVSDILLVILDPRIRFERAERPSAWPTRQRKRRRATPGTPTSGKATTSPRSGSSCGATSNAIGWPWSAPRCWRSPTWSGWWRRSSRPTRWSNVTSRTYSSRRSASACSPKGAWLRRTWSGCRRTSTR